MIDWTVEYKKIKEMYPHAMNTAVLEYLENFDESFDIDSLPEDLLETLSNDKTFVEYMTEGNHYMMEKIMSDTTKLKTDALLAEVHDDTLFEKVIGKVGRVAIKNRMRTIGGKRVLQRRKKVTEKNPGGEKRLKMQNGKVVILSPQEKLKRKLGQRAGARKRVAKMSRIVAKRKITNRLSPF